MGTRSLTVVKDEDGNKIIEMYKQYDGYMEGLGQELLDFINSGTVVNGISVGETKLVFNGMSCLAAQLVSHFKEGPGGIYLHTPTTDYINKKKYYEMYGAEYYYEITNTTNGLLLRCWDTYENKEIFF